MDSTANSTSKKQPLASPTAAVRVASELTTSTPLEHVQSVNVPYAAALTTPNATMRIQSTLPPIAMAQPLNIINQTLSHLHGGSNIPANPNGSKGVFSGEVNSADLNHPYVTVMSMAPPPGASIDAQVDNMRFPFLQKCRWMAGCLLSYYVVTFLFLQPFLIGLLGLFTAVLGLNSSRLPVDMHRFKWLRWYIRANYVMLSLNIWMLIVMLVFSQGMSSYVGNASGSNGASSDEREYVESTYYSNNVNLCIGMLMAINLFMHVRCLRTAQLLTAELLAAGVDRQPAPALVLAASNPISTV